MKIVTKVHVDIYSIEEVGTENSSSLVNLIVSHNEICNNIHGDHFNSEVIDDYIFSYGVSSTRETLILIEQVLTYDTFCNDFFCFNHYNFCYIPV